MPTFKITLAYDGTNFIGWQRQAAAAGTSIQGLIEDALRELDGHDVAVAGAGRTDAGVHALGQVASFSLDRTIETDTVVRALNARLPAEIRVVSAESAAADFHARFGAKTKTYQYRIWNADVMSPFERHYAWHVVGALDVNAMATAAGCLEGRHDFGAFQTVGATPRTTERTVVSSRIGDNKSPTTEDTDPNGGHGRILFGNGNECAVSSLDRDRLRDLSGRDFGGSLIVYEITGDGFLRHMVRAIVGSLVEIGRGRWPSERMREVLASCDRGRAGPTAPAGGLFLVAVEYGDL